jgi:site-specific DNA recombinase
VGPKILELGEEQRELEKCLAAIDEPNATVALHPAAIERYRAMIKDLAADLRNTDRDQALVKVRGLITSITVEPRRAGEREHLTIRGALSDLLGVGSVVPRGGIEPPTLRFSVACSTN